MTASSSSSLRIPAPTHHPAAGARPLRLPFHSVSVSVRPRRSPVSASASPQQAPGPGDGDRANGRTGVPVPVPFSRDAAIALPRPLTSADLMGEASGEGLKVAYQGCPGAYSEAAAKKAYPSCETVPCEYFETAFQPVLKTNDAVSSDSSNTSESAVLGGRVFSSPVVPGAQWRAQTLAGFQNQSETGQFRGRPEILNDSFLELPSNMVSVVSWFFKYAWWFFIEDLSSLEQIKIVIVNLQTAENGW
ncbi:arogenate dehydratase/prephenate dehydratase 2, chloroplastic-like [Hordeum vulgare]|nr:arogenate dehydratase/prephenate dehydratase 2, chloroplastic-like [Hordeum vulgare]